MLEPRFALSNNRFGPKIIAMGNMRLQQDAIIVKRMDANGSGIIATSGMVPQITQSGLQSKLMAFLKLFQV